MAEMPGTEEGISLCLNTFALSTFRNIFVRPAPSVQVTTVCNGVSLVQEVEYTGPDLLVLSLCKALHSLEH